MPGVPDDELPAWCLSAHARTELQTRDSAARESRAWPSREKIARSYSRRRGRISTTEFGGLVGASPTNVGGVLKELEKVGDLRPSRPNRRGPGFFYVSTAADEMKQRRRVALEQVVADAEEDGLYDDLDRMPPPTR